MRSYHFTVILLILKPHFYNNKKNWTHCISYLTECQYVSVWKYLQGHSLTCNLKNLSRNILHLAKCHAGRAKIVQCCNDTHTHTHTGRCVCAPEDLTHPQDPATLNLDWRTPQISPIRAVNLQWAIIPVTTDKKKPPPNTHTSQNTHTHTETCSDILINTQHKHAVAWTLTLKLNTLKCTCERACEG